jgi:hypothetical protein
VEQCIPQIQEVIQKIITEEIPQKISSWTVFDNKTALADVPPILAVILGIQFGQIYKGSWNDFTVAAKKYIALNSGHAVDDFYWTDEAEIPEAGEDFSLRAFGSLMDKFYPSSGDEEDGNKKLKIAQEFEKGVLAYYAMTQEILSRTDFDSNNRSTCTMEGIFRLESLESLKDIGVITDKSTKKDKQKGGKKAGGGNPYAAHNVLQNAKYAAIVSSSARMHVTSLDKAKDFPPPIKVITEYEEVHHARVFACHLFNFDFGNAARELPLFLGKDEISQTISEYSKGCPFFKDRQREFLIMPTGLTANVVGVLAFATEPKNCFVLAADEPFDDDTLAKPTGGMQEELEGTLLPTTDIGRIRKSQIDFCKGENSAEDWLFDYLCRTDRAVRQKNIDAGKIKKRADRGAEFSKIRQEALENYDDRLEILQDYQRMLLAINEEFGFDTLYKAK